MRYISTRGGADPVDFRTALLTGLAPDGGLYVPEAWPRIDFADAVGQNTSYAEIVAAAVAPFTTGFLDAEDLRAMAEDAYVRFGHPDIAPLRRIDDQLDVLELFWGPTLAFKDMAMQMLSRMLDRALADRGERATILGATSGDTGSAAIEALRDRDTLDVVILYPHGRVSEVQRRQMTTVESPNVHALAIDGTFDDCQDLVKWLFSQDGPRERFGFSTANSINWGRVVSQIPYYVWAATAEVRGRGGVAFAVPSGNFGNAFSAYAAAQMGLDVSRIAVGSNANHVLSSFFDEGLLRLGSVVPTVAPSMDIQVPSNLERLLFDVYDREGSALAAAMTSLRSSGRLEVGRARGHAATVLFTSSWTDDDGARAVIRDVYANTGHLVDPHTAIGIHAASQCTDRPIVALATAHPSKFPEVVRAATGSEPELPGHLADLLSRSERVEVLPADPGEVLAHLDAHVRQRV